MEVKEFISALQASQLYGSDARVKEAVDAAIQGMEAAGSINELRTLTEALATQIKAILEGNPASKLEKADQEWLNGILDRDYTEATVTLNLVLDATKGEQAPTKEQVLAAILRSLSPEQVAELKKLREPVLLIVPDAECERFKSAINKLECKNQGSISGQQDAYVAEFYQTTMAEVSAHYRVQSGQPISGYRFAIVEGMQDFDCPDSSEPWNKRVEMRVEARISVFEAHFTQKGVQSMDAPAYMMLMMRGLRTGRPMDSKQFTLLCGEPKASHIKDGCVAFGRWNVDKASFRDVILDFQAANARLRASVMGKI